jgi:WD40 repeat protein
MLAAQLTQLSPHESMQKTANLLREDERTLHLAAALALADRPSSERILWVVDQFEEVFTLCRDEEERSLFLVNLVYAASAPGGCNVVVLTLRADFYPRCAAYPALAQQLAARQYLVSPLDREGLRQVIVEPAAKVGLELEPGLAETILNDVESQPGALPLLEFALLELWRRRSGRRLTLQGYRDAGGVHRAIATTADSVFLRFSPQEQEIVRHILLRLTQPGEGTEDTRRRAAYDELLSTSAMPEAVEEVLTTLVRERLLTTSTDPSEQERWVDVSHEALIRGWPTLRAWIEQDREGLREHRRVTEAAQEWQRHDREEDYLYRGASLARAVEWREAHRAALNDLEEIFLQASVDLRERQEEAERERDQRELQAARALAEAEAAAQRERADAARGREQQAHAVAAAERRRTRMTRLFSAVLVLLFVASGLVAVLAVRAQATATNETRAAQAQRVAAESGEALSTDPELGLLLGIEAVKLKDTPQTEAALSQALAEAPERRELPLPGPSGSDLANYFALLDLRTYANPNSVAFSPDGRAVVTTSGDGAARIWDWRSGRLLQKLQNHPSLRLGGNVGIESAAFSPDGRELAAAVLNQTVQIWDWHRRAVVQTLRESGDFNPTSVNFSPDGRYIVAAALDAAVQIWDRRTGKIVRTLPGGETYSASFSPDGRYILTAPQIWDWRRDVLVKTLPGAGSLNTRILYASFNPDGRYVITTNSDHMARIWDWRRGRSIPTPATGSSDITDAAFSPDGQEIVTASIGDTTQIWDWRHGRVVQTLAGHTDTGTSVAFSPDGRYVVTTSFDEKARVWDWQNGVTQIPASRRSRALQQLERLLVRNSTVTPDGHCIVEKGQNGTLEVQDQRRTKVSWRLVQSGVVEIGGSFSPDGRYVLATTSSGAALIWDWRHPTPLSSFGGATSSTIAPIVASFSPDGKDVLTMGDGQTAQVWDWRSHALLKTLPNAALGMNFDPSGAYVAAVGVDGTVRVWDWRTGTLVVRLAPPGESAVEAAFTRDGRSLLVLYKDGTGRIYPWGDLQPRPGLLAFAEGRATRTLTPQERSEFLP